MSRAAITDLATKNLWIKEDPAGSNLTKYGAWYDEGNQGKKLNGKPWCAIFVSYIYAMTGQALPHIDTAKGFHYVPSGYNWFVRNKKITTEPQPGDIIIFDWELGTLKETAQQALPDHTGLFLSWIDKKNGTLNTIEGNTSSGSNSNGGQVQKRIRTIAKIKAFVNILNLQ